MKATMKVEAHLDKGFKTDVKCSHPFVIDQPKQAGGTDLGPNPLEFFLSSLAGCVCAIGRIISNQRKLNVRSINVKLEGDIDKDFLLGITQEGRAGFEEFRMKVDIDADMTDEEKMNFLNDIAKRCPVADNIKEISVLKADLA